MTNSHLVKRLEKMKANRNALLSQQWDEAAAAAPPPPSTTEALKTRTSRPLTAILHLEHSPSFSRCNTMRFVANQKKRENCSTGKMELCLWKKQNVLVLSGDAPGFVFCFVFFLFGRAMTWKTSIIKLLSCWEIHLRKFHSSLLTFFSPELCTTSCYPFLFDWVLGSTYYFLFFSFFFDKLHEWV